MGMDNGAGIDCGSEGGRAGDSNAEKGRTIVAEQQLKNKNKKKHESI